MKFFKKQGVAVTICIVMIVAAIAIGFFGSAGKTENKPDSAASAADWGREHTGEYVKFISDGAGLLSDSAVQKLAQTDAELDYTYSSIVAVAVVDGLGGQDIEDAAYDYGSALGCGETDLMLLIDTGSSPLNSARSMNARSPYLPFVDSFTPSPSIHFQFHSILFYSQ